MTRALASIAALVVVASSSLAHSPSPGLYDPNPDQIWNRVHRVLHVRVDAAAREYGEDDVDSLLWPETKYLLTSPSHERALKLLDEFLATHAEQLVRDPLERAVFQHDVWSVFDWVEQPWARDYVAERRELAARLAKVMHRVALTKSEIARLPDNYAAANAPFLPRDLFDPKGAWLRLTDSFDRPMAASHAEAFSNSEFSVFLQVPGGAAATEAYLKTLWDFPQPYVPEAFSDGEQRVSLNPDLPQVPVGTSVALARTMLLVDAEGHLERTKLLQSLQLRVLHGPFTRDHPFQTGHAQAVYEFRMGRRALFANDGGGIRAVAPDETGFLMLSTQGVDAFEPPHRFGPTIVLKQCNECHQQSGIFSINIARRLLKPNARLDFRHPRWSVYAQPAIDAKTRRRDWVLLQELW